MLSSYPHSEESGAMVNVKNAEYWPTPHFKNLFWGKVLGMMCFGVKSVKLKVFWDEKYGRF